MMSAATDTLRTAEALREAGVNERQAAATARAVEDAVADATGELVTRDHLRAELATLRDALTWRIVGIVAGLLALFRGLEWMFGL